MLQFPLYLLAPFRGSELLRAPRSTVWHELARPWHDCGTTRNQRKPRNHWLGTMARLKSTRAGEKNWSLHLPPPITGYRLPITGSPLRIAADASPPSRRLLQIAADHLSNICTNPRLSGAIRAKIKISRNADWQSAVSPVGNRPAFCPTFIIHPS